ncbi:MAG: site-2 protease family protein, partial [Planctomycetota bacterium]
MGLYLIAFSMEALGARAWQIGSVAAGLGLVIFVHELGHFLVAKWCGVKCEKFYVGFDVPIKIFGLQLPSKLVHFQWGETEYGIGIIPLGGYVKMLGQDDDPRAAQAELERIRIKKAKDDGGTEHDGAPSEPSKALAAESHSDDQVEYELDPRSFPAKTVPQRMGIISAGVIMNLIFAVLFATYAFRAGVPYTPCEVGGVVPGSPAWIHGVEPQSRIVQVGQHESRKSFLRFTWDLSNGVQMVNDGEALRIVTLDPDGEEHSYDIIPSTIDVPGQKRRMLGIAPALTCQLAPDKPAYAGSSAQSASPELKGEDTIKAVNGTAIHNSYELQKLLATDLERPITLSIEREEKGADGKPNTTTHEVTVEPNHIRRLGLVMKTGPIVGIRPGSPAEAAGFRAGDLIETIAGEPIGDPMSLPTQIRPYHEQEIEIQVRRKDEVIPLRVTPRTPTEFDWTFAENSPMASVALGLAFQVDREVQAVIAGSPADKAGVKPGDVAVAFKALYDEPKNRSERGENQEKPLKLDDTNVTWSAVFNACQYLPENVSLNLSMQRGGQVQ